MLRPLGFYLSLGISHNIPGEMRPKIVVPQEDIGGDLPTPSMGGVGRSPPISSWGGTNFGLIFWEKLWPTLGIGRKYGLSHE